MSKSKTICSLKKEEELKFRKPVASNGNGVKDFKIKTGNIIKDDLLPMEDQELPITLQKLKKHTAQLGRVGIEITNTLVEINMAKRIIPSYGPILFF
jgi:hypothetical protein